MLDDVKNTPVTYPESKYPPDGKAPVAFGIPAWLCVPASASPTSAQFRKNLWPLRNHRLELGFWGSQQSFRNWGQGDERNAGVYIPAGAPNITGRAEARTGGVDLVSGCFSTGGAPALINAALSGVTNGFMFDASKSSSVYGGADTIMPPSINQPVVLYLGRPT